MSDNEKLEGLKKRYTHARDADKNQREREIAALRFQDPEQQWDEDARKARQGDSSLGIAPRPMLSVSLVDQPIQLVTNQQRQARLGVNIQPVSPDATGDDAEIREGLYRKIERDSQAHIARGWAFDRAVKSGRGYYVVNTEYDDAGGDPFDQRIVIERIQDQRSVYFDPAAQKADFSDAEYCGLVKWVSRDDFLRQWPDVDIEQEGSISLEDDDVDEPLWVKDDGETKAILVAREWRKEHKFEKVEVEIGGRTQTRTRDIVTVTVTYFTGFTVLEEYEWNGKHLPIVTVVGRELQPFDEERRWQGMIEPAMGAQKIHNYAISQAIEAAALEPKAPFILDPRQIEDYEPWWKQANVRNWPYLPAKLVIDGQAVPPPQRSQADTSHLAINMQLVEMSKGAVQTATFVYDPGLGRQNSREKSGKAILALQEQSEAGNSGYLQNMADIAMQYEAKVVLDLMPAIYDRPGRIARTLDLEDNTEEIVLNQPFYTDPKTKRPVPIEDGGVVPPGVEVKNYDLRRGSYGVAVTIGKTANTARQEAVEALGRIIEAAPDLLPVVGPRFYKQSDFPGHNEVAEDLIKLRDKMHGDLFKADGEQASPQQLQARLQAMQQENQMLKQQMEQAAKALEMEQAKQQATVAKAQLDGQSKVEVAQIQAAMDLRVAQLKAELDLQIAQMKAMLQAQQSQQQMAHDMEMGARAEEHAERMESMKPMEAGALAGQE